MAIEEPKFTVIQQQDRFELRDYAASVVAEVTVTGDRRQIGSQGFRLLAGYIFGGNAGGKRIAMTAPVTLMPKNPDADSGEWVVRFTLPSGSDLADLPVPNAAAVRLRALPAARYGVLRFSGWVGPAQIARRAAELTRQIAALGLTTTGPLAIARYNPPWTPWFLRRNEVMFQIASA